MANPKEEVPENPVEEIKPSEEVEAPVEEPKPSEAPEEEAIEEEVPEEPEIPPEKPSRRESLRIQQVIEKAKAGEYNPKSPDVGGMDFKTALNAAPEVIEQLETDRKAVAEAQFQAGIKQADAIKWETRLEVDAPRVETKYPVLDKDSETFNPVVANAINQWYLSTAGFDAKTREVTNPNVRYSEFVEGVMELADEMAGEKVSKTTKNIAKQAASTALRPGGNSAKRLNLNQDPKNMSDEELAAVIAQAIPST